MVVIDLTVAGKNEAMNVMDVVPKVTVARKKVAGLPCLSAAAMTSTDRINLLNLREEGATRVLKPEFFFRLRTKERDNEEDQKIKLGYFSEEATRAIVKLFGTKGAMSTNETQETKLKAEGVEPIDDYLKEKVIARVTSEPRILQHLAGNADRVLVGKDSYSQRDLKATVQVIFNDKELCNQLGLPHGLTDEDQLYLLIWKEIAVNFGRYVSDGSNTEVAKAKKLIADLPTDPTAKDVYDMIEDNALLDLLDMDKVSKILRTNTKADKLKATKTREIILLALMG
jgi:hypothetical protein